jgi:hypothetical protein
MRLMTNLSPRALSLSQAHGPGPVDWERVAVILGAAERARPLAEWHEDIGDVLWWAFPVEEAPYVGSPLDLGHTVEAHTPAGMASRFMVGGWPGYHTHWTPLPSRPAPPADAEKSEEAGRG